MLKNIFGNKKINFPNLYNSINNLSLKHFGAYRSNPALSVPYEKEKAEYKKKKKEMHKAHIQEFWEEQTKVENNWVNEYMKDQKEKKRRDDARLRTILIKNAYKSYRNIQQEIENQKKFLAKQKLWREEDTQELLEKHSLLNLLDRQAEEDWLTPDNIESKLSFQMNKILPPTILSHVDYYSKLNRYALLMEAGLSEEAESVKVNKEVIDYKNRQLQPLYDELKMVIKHLTYTEEHAVYSLYKETILRIENYFNPEQNKHDANFLKDKLTHLFKRLISLIREENQKADNKLEVMEKQLKALTMILVIWNKYVEIIYTPDKEIEDLISRQKDLSEEFKSHRNPLKNKSLEDLIDEKDPRILKEYYMSKITDKKAKGSGLFIKDIRGLNDDVYLRKEIEEKMDELSGKKKIGKAEEMKSITSGGVKEKEEYTTESEEDSEGADQLEVSSPSTTGRNGKTKIEKQASRKKGERLALTSEAGKNPKTNQETSEKKNKKTGINQEKRKLLENEVSEVFDDEDAFEEEKIEVEDEVESVKKEQTYTSKSSKSTQPSQATLNTSDHFADPLNPQLAPQPKKERKLLEEFMLMSVKRQVEESKYNNLDVEAELKTYKANLVKDLGLKDEKDLFADIDKELEDIDLSKVINMNEFENELKKESERLTLEKEFENSKKQDLLSSSIFDTILKYSKDIYDFKTPKISTDLDIYDENLIKFLEYSAKEAEVMHKSTQSSVIMQFIKEELEKIDEEELSPANQLKKKHLIRVTDVLSKMRIADSQNLKSVFDLNKHPLIKF